MTIEHEQYEHCVRQIKERFVNHTLEENENFHMQRIVHLLFNIKLQYFEHKGYGYAKRQHTEAQQRTHGSRFIVMNQLACKEKKQKQREQYALNRFFKHRQFTQHVAVMYADKRYQPRNSCIDLNTKQHKIGYEKIFVTYLLRYQHSHRDIDKQLYHIAERKAEIKKSFAALKPH